VERREDLRAADADRNRVGDRLREALNEGRINLTEYDERLQHAYNAKTYGELDKLLDDLPKVTPPQQGQVATTGTADAVAAPTASARQPEHRPKAWLAGVWGSWLTASLITTGVWAATSITSGSVRGFWPIWVIVPFGAVCLAQTIRRLSGDDSGRHLRERRERRERRDRRRGRY
jgi:hypothetical protein